MPFADIRQSAFCGFPGPFCCLLMTFIASLKSKLLRFVGKVGKCHFCDVNVRAAAPADQDTAAFVPPHTFTNNLIEPATNFAINEYVSLPFWFQKFQHNRDIFPIARDFWWDFAGRFWINPKCPKTMFDLSRIPFQNRLQGEGCSDIWRGYSIRHKPALATGRRAFDKRLIRTHWIEACGLPKSGAQAFKASVL